MQVIHSHSKKMLLSAVLALAAAVPAASAQSGQEGATSGQSGQTARPGATQGQQDRPAAGTASTSGSQGRSGTAGASGTAGTGASTPYVFVLLPVELAPKENSTKSGCWAKIYDRENFSGDSLTLAGPVSLADMSGPFGLNWDDKVNSIELGPKASVTVFDNEAFRDQVAQFKPGQRVPDLSRRLGFFDEFASIRMSCTG